MGERIRLVNLDGAGEAGMSTPNPGLPTSSKYKKHRLSDTLSTEEAMVSPSIRSPVRSYNFLLCAMGAHPMMDHQSGILAEL
jgi:hypothetical protein